MAVGFPLKTTYANGDVYSAGDVNDTNGTVNLLTSAQLAAGKNALINGTFDIWQRGTSFTAGNSYTADRWYLTGTVPAVTISRESSTVATGSLYSLKIAPTGGSGVVNMNQAIETLNAIRFAGQTVTLSVDAAATASTTISTQLYHSSSTDNAVGGTWTQITATSGGSGTVSTYTFSKISGVYSVPSTAKSLLVVIVSSGTAGQSAFLDNVQLELGATASAFARAGGTIQGELAACQRYYEKSYNIATASGSNITGTTVTISEAGASIVQVPVTGVAGSNRGRSVPQPYKVSKRVAPTIRFWDLAGNINRYTSANVNGNFVADNRALDTFGAVYTISDWAFGWQTVAANSADIYCGIMWEASAEL